MAQIQKDSELTRDEINSIAEGVTNLGYGLQMVCLSGKNECQNNIVSGDYRATVRITTAKDPYGSIVLKSEISLTDTDSGTEEFFQDAKTALETVYVKVFRESRGLELLSRKGIEEQIVAGLAPYGYDMGQSPAELTCGSEYCMRFLQLKGAEGESYKIKLTTGVGDYLEKGAHIDISVLATAPGKDSDRIAEMSDLLKTRINDIVDAIYGQDKQAPGDLLQKENHEKISAKL